MKRISDLAHVSQGLAVSGRGAGARSGDWELRLAESADIADDRLELEGLRTISIQRNARTEKHLLRPYDVLVTARSQAIKVALVPPAVSRTAAGVTLLVISAAASGMGRCPLALVRPQLATWSVGDRAPRTVGHVDPVVAGVGVGSDRGPDARRRRDPPAGRVDRSVGTGVSGRCGRRAAAAEDAARLAGSAVRR